MAQLLQLLVAQRLVLAVPRPQRGAQLLLQLLVAQLLVAQLLVLALLRPQRQLLLQLLVAQLLLVLPGPC